LQICLLGIILDTVCAIFYLFEVFFVYGLRLCLRIEVSDF
jgi:hypothetical protein